MIKVPSVARSLYSVALSLIEMHKVLVKMQRIQAKALRQSKRPDITDPRFGGEWIEE